MDTSNKWTGQRFGKLVVVGPSDPGKGEYLFACDCGQSVKRNLHTARRNTANGHTVSCGCSRSYAHMTGTDNPQHKKYQPKPMAKCEHCQKNFQVFANRPGQRYCSTLCSNYAKAAKRNSRIAMSFLGKLKAKIRHYKRKCKVCEAPLADLEAKRIFCSRKCNQAFVRRSSYGHWLASKRRKEVIRTGDGTTINSLANKYGWKCQLCSKKIDPRLLFPDP